ncbi:unnamed protein product [Lepidochelys olivacea]
MPRHLPPAPARNIPRSGLEYQGSSQRSDFTILLKSSCSHMMRSDSKMSPVRCSPGYSGAEIFAVPLGETWLSPEDVTCGAGIKVHVNENPSSTHCSRCLGLRSE